MTTDIHTLAGAYALDAVDDIERAAFTRHLRECTSCAIETDEFQLAAARLADGAWSVPPPRLRDDVMARIASTRQESPNHRRDKTRDKSDGRLVRRWRAVTAAAVAAGIVAVGGTYVTQEQRIGDQRAATAAAQAQEAQVRTVLDAPDAVVRHTLIKTGGQLTVVTSASLNTGVVMVTDAKTLPKSQAYEVWLMQDQELATAVRAVVFPAGIGTHTAVVHGLQGRNTMAITFEKAGGVARPTADNAVASIGI